MSENRNEDGTFTSAEPLVGQEGVEADQGFTRMPEAVEDRPEPTSDIMSEVKSLQAKREQSDTDIVDLAYRRPDGEISPQNLTVPFDVAVKNIGDFHAAEAEVARRVDDSTLSRYVDGLRGEVLAENPDLAKDFGLSKEEVAAAAAVKAEDASPSEINDAARAEMAKQATEEPSPYDGIEGLDEPTRQALKVPAIREAVEKEFTKAAETQQAYTVALQQGQQVARATIASLAPQLNDMPLEMWPQAIQAIAQTDPVRGKLVVDTLQNWNAIQQAEQQQRQYQTHAERQRIEAWGKGQDAEVMKAVGELSPIQKQEFVNDTLSFFQSNGVQRDELAREVERNPALRSKSFQLMAWQAHQYRQMQKAAKPIAQKNLPPVTRPGTSVHRSSGDNSSQIAALQKQVASLTGDKQVRAAAKLQALQRKTG